MRTLVTGITGFIGSHLRTELVKTGAVVFGLTSDRRKETPEVRFGALERSSLRKLIETEKIDVVFHLAGRSVSRDVSETYAGNVKDAREVLEAVREADTGARVITMGSAAEYGPTLHGETLDENHELRPVMPYGTSKAAVSALALQMHREHGLRTHHVRAFNIIGPGQSQDFLVPQIARQLVFMEQGRQEHVLKLGHLGSYRDFVDVRDLAIALTQIARLGGPGEVYNVCSGRAVAVSEVVKTLISRSKVKPRLDEDSTRVNKPSVDYVCGNYQKLHRLTGWEPRLPLEISLADVLEEWRRHRDTMAQ